MRPGRVEVGGGHDHSLSRRRDSRLQQAECIRRVTAHRRLRQQLRHRLDEMRLISVEFLVVGRKETEKAGGTLLVTSCHRCPETAPHTVVGQHGIDDIGRCQAYRPPLLEGPSEGCPCRDVDPCLPDDPLPPSLPTSENGAVSPVLQLEIPGQRDPKGFAGKPDSLIPQGQVVGSSQGGFAQQRYHGLAALLRAQSVLGRLLLVCHGTVVQGTAHRHWET